jgi:hypothetical protein
MAGFEVATYGRFWVAAEALHYHRKREATDRIIIDNQN